MRAWPTITWTAGLVLIGALGVHWGTFFYDRAQDRAAGVRLVVFGPSGWDTLMPGTPLKDSMPVIERLDIAFRERHPEVGQVVHDARGPVSDGVARLRNAYIAGNIIDVVICAANPVNTAYARLGLIEPVTDFVRKYEDRFTPEAIGNFQVGNEVWGAPLSVVNISTFFYNRDLFDRLGIRPPTSDAEFIAIAPRLRDAGVIPIVHQGKNAWMWTPWFYNALVQTSGGQHKAYLDDILKGRARFSDRPGLEALQLTRRWMTIGLLDPQSGELDEDGMKAAFLSGRAATFLGGTWDIPGIRAKAAFRWGTFRFPKIVGTAGNPRSFGGAEMGLCVARGSHQPKLARAYIEFLTRPENASQLLLPQRPFATSAQQVSGLPGPIEEALRQALPAEKPLEWGMPAEVNEMVQRALQSMMAGATTPEATAVAMQNHMDRLLADAREGHR